MTDYLETYLNDPEELALTLNGKKSKFKPDDFIKFGSGLNLNEKQIRNSVNRFRDGISGALSFIGSSFLSDDKKEEYKQLLVKRSVRLGIMIILYLQSLRTYI